ncbi:putative nuclease HARBI1 isoform X2 [Eurosta solidaginis]|uniref:putative nuclease HARBI1 isoform X2 n=1 Tax=Eurosta solidaginis TaxID=178769 RepID=UPI003530C758
MAPILLFCLSSSDSEGDEKIVRRRLRERSNPLDLSNKAFLKRFPLTKDAFSYLLEKLNLKQADAKAVPPFFQLAVTLSLLASGGYQHNVGSDYLVGMCQSTVSKLTSYVVAEMERKLCAEFICFEPDDSQSLIGCVDGTHIGLEKPIANEHMYFNRKGYHSINSMIICDHTYKILAINCQYGAAAHDSFVWKHSDQRRDLEDGFQQIRHRNSWILGDSGYLPTHMSG